jgi:hypothetical protein
MYCTMRVSICSTNSPSLSFVGGQALVAAPSTCRHHPQRIAAAGFSERNGGFIHLATTLEGLLILDPDQCVAVALGAG